MNFVWAFLVGGLICVVGQLLIDLTKLTPARILVLYVVAGVVLSALGRYDPLVDFAGAGATVPLHRLRAPAGPGRNGFCGAERPCGRADGRLYGRRGRCDSLVDGGLSGRAAGQKPGPELTPLRRAQNPAKARQKTRCSDEQRVYLKA